MKPRDRAIISTASPKRSPPARVGGSRHLRISTTRIRLLTPQLKDGTKPEAVVAMAFAEKGLKGWMALAADELGVRTQRGQWWLPG